MKLLTAMDKVSKRVQEQKTSNSIHTFWSSVYSQKSSVKKKLNPKSLIYPIIAWLLLIVLTIMYFTFM